MNAYFGFAPITGLNPPIIYRDNNREPLLWQS